jgi:hypothetical protein
MCDASKEVKGLMRLCAGHPVLVQFRHSDHRTSTQTANFASIHPLFRGLIVIGCDFGLLIERGWLAVEPLGRVIRRL